MRTSFAVDGENVREWWSKNDNYDLMSKIQSGRGVSPDIYWIARALDMGSECCKCHSEKSAQQARNTSILSTNSSNYIRRLDFLELYRSLTYTRYITSPNRYIHMGVPPILRVIFQVSKFENPTDERPLVIFFKHQQTSGLSWALFRYSTIISSQTNVRHLISLLINFQQEVYSKRK